MSAGELGSPLREFRCAAGLSQEALAERARLSPGAITAKFITSRAWARTRTRITQDAGAGGLYSADVLTSKGVTSVALAEGAGNAATALATARMAMNRCARFFVNQDRRATSPTASHA